VTLSWGCFSNESVTIDTNRTLNQLSMISSDVVLDSQITVLGNFIASQSSITLSPNAEIIVAHNLSINNSELTLLSNNQIAIRVQGCVDLHDTTIVLDMTYEQSNSYNIPFISSAQNCFDSANSNVVIQTNCQVQNTHITNAGIVFQLSCENMPLVLGLSIGIPAFAILGAFIIFVPVIRRKIAPFRDRMHNRAELLQQ